MEEPPSALGPGIVVKSPFRHGLIEALHRVVAVATLLMIGLAACGHPTGTITGRLVTEGGPRPRPQPLHGTVLFTGPETKSVPVGKDGTFRIELQAGTYTVVGHSPQYQDSMYSCRPDASPVVRDSATTSILVVCPLI
jgi:hypothetical protein